jgi:hypothetical protein
MAPRHPASLHTFKKSKKSRKSKEHEKDMKGIGLDQHDAGQSSQLFKDILYFIFKLSQLFFMCMARRLKDAFFYIFNFPRKSYTFVTNELSIKIQHLWVTWNPWLDLERKVKLLAETRSVLWKPCPSDLVMNRCNVPGLVFYVAVSLSKQDWYWRFPTSLGSTSPAHVTVTHEAKFQSYLDYWNLYYNAKDILRKGSLEPAWLHLERSWNDPKGKGKGEKKHGVQEHDRNMFFSIPTSCPGGAILIQIQLLLTDMENRNPQNLHISIAKQ